MEQTKKSNKLKIIIPAIIVILAIAGIVIGILAAGGIEKTPKKMSKEEMLKVAKPITNEQILDDFEVNEKNAKDKYKGSIYTYTGVVKEIGDDYVALDKGTSYMGNHKKIYLSDTELKSLRKEEKITVVGKISGISGDAHFGSVYILMEEAYLVTE